MSIYRLWCITELKMVYTGHQHNPPVTCPNSVSHEIDLNTVTDIEKEYIAMMFTIANHNPSVIDDETNGFKYGYQWFNTSIRQMFICVDSAANAAVWLPFAGEGRTGESGYSGYAGADGMNGADGISGYSGKSGYSGFGRDLDGGLAGSVYGGIPPIDGEGA